MYIYRCLIILLCLFLYNCSASYEKINKNEYSIDQNFSGFLFEAYKKKADFEALEMHDWNSAKLYSEKAISAMDGNNILPQKISYWNISEENKFELNKSYINLMSVYEDAISLDPFNLAKAISSLDCWSEQLEESWQTWDINKCRDDFLSALHNIYNHINENKKNNKKKLSSKSQISNDTASLVTEDKNKNILQIIYFDFDKSNLTSISINEIKDFIKKNKRTIDKYIIVGHSDTMGTRKYNIKLSLERAHAVKKILVESGINSDNIKLLGKGEEELSYLTKDETPHPLNRRAEISPLN